MSNTPWDDKRHSALIALRLLSTLHHYSPGEHSVSASYTTEAPVETLPSTTIKRYHINTLFMNYSGFLRVRTMTIATFYNVTFGGNALVRTDPSS